MAASPAASKAATSTDTSGSGRHSAADEVSLGALLTITPPAVEQRFWAARASRLVSLDATFEMCSALVWVFAAPGLAGAELTVGKLRCALSLLQLACCYLAPQLWLQHRNALLAGALLARCSLLVPWQQLGLDGPLAVALGEAAGHGRPLAASRAPVVAAAASPAAATAAAAGLQHATLALVASGFWSNLLLTLFHQQPFALQAPLLLLSCGLQGWGVLSSSAGEAAALAPLVRGLHWAFDHLAAGLVGLSLPAALPAGGAGAGQSAAQQLCTAVLFLHAYCGLVLPLFLAYTAEWRLKVAFLLREERCEPAAQLRVLSPAAAVSRGSSALSAVLHCGWLVLLAVLCWVLAVTAATLLVA